MGKRDNKGERPYVITYIKGDRHLRDSAKSLDGAKARIALRLAKKHNRGETAVVYLYGHQVFDSASVTPDKGASGAQSHS